MRQMIGLVAIVLGLGIASFTAVRAFADAATAPATAPATMPACCGDACKGMGTGCCKADDKGAVPCGMGGSCCKKTGDK